MRSRKQRNHSPGKNNTATVVGIVILAVFLLAVGISIGRGLREERSRRAGSAVQSPVRANPSAQLAEAQRQDPLWPQIKAVAENFICGCGQCGEMRLDGCTCAMADGGVYEKEFIRQKLAEGHNVEHVITLVSERYGGRISNGDTLNHED